MGPLETAAKKYATRIHADVNQLYGELPYSYHLEMVRDVASKWIDYIPVEHRDAVLAACWVHDIIEDGRETYNDVKKICGPKVADLAYALTNEKGKNRAERANEKYYTEMRSVPYACFIKLCDRIANATVSSASKSSMLKKYSKEYRHFIVMVSEPLSMWPKLIYSFPYFRSLFYDSYPSHPDELRYSRMWLELKDLIDPRVLAVKALNLRRNY